MNLASLTTLLLLIGCSERKPHIVPDIFVEDSSGVQLETVAYMIPNGKFRGVTWPKDQENVFQIWVVDNEEYFFNLPSPIEGPLETKRGKWTATRVRSSAKNTVWLATDDSGSREYFIELPKGPVDFQFHSFDSVEGREILVFMNISEAVRQEGIFGIATLK